MCFLGNMTIVNFRRRREKMSEVKERLFVAVDVEKYLYMDKSRVLE